MAFSRDDRRDELAERAVSLGVPLRRELKADRKIVLEAVKQDRGAIVYAAEELRLATRVVQLVAESAGADVSVRCLNMGGEEMAVLQCAPELAARQLVAREVNHMSCSRRSRRTATGALQIL